MRLAFAGTPEFAAKALEALHRRGHEVALVLTQPDRPVGRGLKLMPGAVKQYAVSHELPVYQPESLKGDDALARLREARPRVLVVAAYGKILPPAFLAVPELGALNIHASLLPRWRGAAPIQRALLAGDRTTGISIMQMDAGLDTGPVIEQREIAIADDDDAGTLHAKLAALGAEAVLDVLNRLESGPVAARPQPSEGVTYAAKLSRGDTVLDWTKSALELERAVRALRPAPGASTTLDGEPLKIWAARASVEPGEPGVIARCDEEAILIGCGQGSLAVTELQRAGGRRLSAGEFVRGQRLVPGARLR